MRSALDNAVSNLNWTNESPEQARGFVGNYRGLKLIKSTADVLEDQITELNNQISEKDRTITEYQVLCREVSERSERRLRIVFLLYNAVAIIVVLIALAAR